MTAHRDALKAALIISMLALGCSDSTSASFASLRFSEQPTGVVAGQPIGFAIEFVDADGARASVNDNVIVALGEGETATGAKTIAVRNGVATVDDYIVTSAGENRVLSATAQGLSAVSLPFSVVAAEPDGAHSAVVTPTGQSLLSNTPRAIVFTFADQYGNPIPRAEVSVTSDLAGATFTPSGGKATNQGTFQTTYRPPAIGTAHFSAVVNGRSISLPSPLPVISACTPTAVSIPGTMSGTLAQEQGCILNGQPFQFFQFTTATGGGVSMNVSPTFSAEFEIRPDPAVPTIRLVALQESVTREYLLPAGTYQFRIGSFAGSGTYTVAAGPTPANQGSTLRLIVVPGTYTGQTLASGDLVNSIGTFTDSYALFSDRPCTITVRSTAFDPFINLTNQFGINVGFDNDGGGGTDAQITRPSCISNGGAIRIDVASVNSGGTGPYTLIITYN